MHQRLKLLIGSLKVQLQVRTVGINGGVVDGNFFGRRGIHLLVEDAG